MRKTFELLRWMKVLEDIEFLCLGRIWGLCVRIRGRKARRQVGRPSSADQMELGKILSSVFCFVSFLFCLFLCDKSFFDF